MVARDGVPAAVLLRATPPAETRDYRRHRVFPLDPLHGRRYAPLNPHTHLGHPGWRLTHTTGVPLQRSCEQPSNVRSVYKCFCELSELVHQSLYILHSPGRPLTSRDLLGIYTQYLDWYDRIPVVLRLGHNFTPAVLFAQ